MTEMKRKTKEDLQKQLEMTEMTLLKVLGEKKELLEQKTKMSKYSKTLRFKIRDSRKQIIDLKSNFVLEKLYFKNKINLMKKEIFDLTMKTMLYDDNDNQYVVDPTTGVIDMTQPQTPPKPKLNKYVSSKPMKKMKM